MGFLHPTVAELADKAIRKINAGEATSFPDAARKAVIGAGISNQSEVRKKAREIVRELGRRAQAHQHALKEAQELRQKISG